MRGRGLHARTEVVEVGPLRLGLGWLAPAGRAADRRHVVALVHGIGMSHRSFHRLQSVVSMRHPTVTVDLPGFGGVPGPGRSVAVEDLGDAVVGALVARGVRTVTVLGQSMGSQVAIEAALRHPDTVTGVVLVGPVIDDRRRTLRRQVSGLRLDGLVETLRMDYVLSTDYLRSVRQYLLQVAPMMRYRTLERFAAIRQPAAVVRGLRDPVSRGAWARRLTHAHPGAWLAEFPGPHHVQERQPVGIADVVDRVVTAGRR